MEKRKLGRTGLEVTTCCLGTMTWGQQNTEAEGHEQMDYALDRGINFFDTAELYSIPRDEKTQGSTERIIGSWFKDRGARDKVILASKIVGRTDATWYRDRDDLTECRMTKDQVDEAVEKSLTRLQTDYIDLYQLHWPDRVAPIFGGKMRKEHYAADYEPFEEILSHLNDHVKKGNILHIGLSNETAFGVMRFLAESDKHDLPRVQSIQNAYSLVNRTFEEALEEVCVHEEVSLLAYSPLAQGYLTGKYRNGAEPESSRKKLFHMLGRYEKPHAEDAINSYVDLAAEKGLDPAKLAIKFCDTRHFVTSTIIGATTMDQLKTCLDAFDMEWSDELEKEVNKLHARQPNPCP
ncbi:aldo/keto reductase [Ponticaulis sp.]|uniref:aldo/keto reductase n=1 Tax=Ponticaulis sp. TaxID=2020902 RepID=UPI000B65EACE|nr:aldo/keto reductase [Ponticaulis sp.]MAI90993.1 aldo/keto reductase [Ponticaulis sp.]OUX98334.1 MAG: aldo/keto reductase [Hyphomonadaceae bacterium TMED5]|tara:strand:- start:144907 stop:145956 length:1050 start_codon:yes stop_codon:yes gene_type:complete